MKTLASILLIAFVFAGPIVVEAKGGGGGGHASSGGRSFSSGRTVSTATTRTAPVAKAPTAPKPAPTPTKPTATTPKVTKTTQTTVAGKTYAKTGNVVGTGYQPKFQGGVTPPAGSVVYYRQSSLLDWFPIWYILSHDSHRDAVVQSTATSTDGTVKTTETPVQEEGVDTMYVVNWLLTILIGVGLIAGTMWLINKYSKKYV